MKADESDTASWLDATPTDDLINALRRRSRVFFCCMRPLAEHPSHDWSRYWCVDGIDHKQALKTGLPDEGEDRVLGLVQRATFDMLYVPPTLDDIV